MDWKMIVIGLVAIAIFGNYAYQIIRYRRGKLKEPPWHDHEYP